MVNNSQSWLVKQEIAEKMIPLIGQLYRQNHVVCLFFDYSMIHCSVNKILHIWHTVNSDYQQLPSFLEILNCLQTLVGLNLKNIRIDVGKILINYSTSQNMDVFLSKHLNEFINRPDDFNTKDIVLYGFGRIGRVLARILIARAGNSGMRLKALVVRKGKASNDVEKRAALLQQDSIHGLFEGQVIADVKKQQIIANGIEIPLLYADHPSKANYSSLDISNAILVDNTGVWRSREDLSMHLQHAEISKVLLTAPGKDDINNIVYGVNHKNLSKNEHIVSAASCTTNAVVPVLQVIDQYFEIQRGHIETIHAYTNDQNLLDNYHYGSRRGRAASLNMVITETGAAKAVGKVLPRLVGKLSGNAIRVPVPNVSLAILNLVLARKTSVKMINDYLEQQSMSSLLHQQIGISRSGDAVSSDFIRSSHTVIVDLPATQVCGNNCILYLWYDNEWGYSCQVYRILQKMSGVMYPLYPRVTEDLVELTYY